MIRFVSRTMAVAPLALATAFTAQAQGRDRASLPGAIDSVVQSFLKDGKAAGMSIAVVKGRDTIAIKGYGSADLELDVPTPAHAVYEIGSVTKQFTAASMLLLQEEGKLSLDDPLTKYLSDYNTQGHTITLRRLLDHTSGIKGYTEMPIFGALMARHLPKDTLVTLFQKEPFDFAPGEMQVYNNSAYFLLGLVIEKVSGKSYADFVKERLFDKAGMSDSQYCSERTVIKRKVKGYDMGPTALVNKGLLDHTWPYAAGSLCSSAADLLTWNRALHGGRILSAASYKAMTSPSMLGDGTRLRYGMGLALHAFNGHRTIEHGGGINGFLSESAYFPDDDAIIVVLINSAGPVSPNAVTTAIADLVLGTVKRESRPTPAAIAAFAGTYKGVGRGQPMVVTVSADSGRLSITMPRQKPATPRYIGDDTWEEGDTRFTFKKKGSALPELRVDAAYGYSVLPRSGS